MAPAPLRLPAFPRRLASLTHGQRYVAGAVGLALLSLVLLFVEPVSSIYGIDSDADALGIALVLGATLPLALLPRSPIRILLVILSCAVAATLLGYAASMTIVVAALAVGLTALETERRRSLLAGVLAGAAIAAAISGGFGPSLPVNVFFGVLIGAIPALVGDAFRTQRALTETLRRNALQLARLSDAETRQAVAEERVRIARDVHDTVGHHLAAISLQAGAGSRRLTDPAAVGRNLETIKAQSSEALLQTKQMLGLLRNGEADRAPTPGLAEMETLIDATRRAGVQVALTVDGPPRDLPQAVDTAGYRILQEALTNVTKHARPAAARVRVEYDSDSVHLEVLDDGLAVATGAPTEQGQGLIGMRERVALLGGAIEAGARPEGGWRVRAVIPTGAAR